MKFSRKTRLFFEPQSFQYLTFWLGQPEYEDFVEKHGSRSFPTPIGQIIWCDACGTPKTTSDFYTIQSHGHEKTSLWAKAP